MKKLLLLPFLFITVLSFGQVPNYVPSNGLVGYWGFNGNANDESGNGNNGTVNGATLTTDRFGNADNAYSFDGIDDYINIPDNISLNNPNLSVGFWIYTNSVIFQQVFYKVSGGTAQNEEYSIPINLNNQNEINLDLKNNSCSPGVGWVSFSNAATLSNWRYVTFTHDGSITRFYLDGNLINSQNASFNIANCPGGDLILGISWDFQNAFNGKLDDIGIWDRALDSNEVNDLFLAIGCTLDPVTSQPTDQTVNIGNNATISFSDTLTGASYKWQMDAGTGYSDLSNAGQFSGADTDSLIISTTTMGNNNTNYRCIVTESASCMDTTDVVLLTVINDASIGELNSSLVTLFPNPSNGHITLTLAQHSNGQIILTDILGKEVLSKRFTTNEVQVNIKRLAAKGTYFAKILDSNGNVIAIKKLIYQ